MNSKDQQNNRILIVSPAAYPLGGVAVWLDYLLTGFSQSELDVHLALADGHFHNASSYLQRYPYAQTVRLDNPAGTQYGRVEAIISAVRKLDPALLVSVNIPDVYRAARTLRATSHAGLKVVGTVHGLEPQIFKDLDHYSDAIDQVIVTNRLTEEMLAELTGIEAKQISYAPYGVQVGDRAREYDTKCLRLLYCGRIEESQKRCSHIVEIVKQLELKQLDYVLRIAGDGPDKNRFLADLTKFASAERIKYLGALSAQELQVKGYGESDILLLTSEWETGPIVAWEAMAAGLVVVCSRYFGLVCEGALKHRHNCLIFDQGDAKAATESLSSLSDPELFGKLIQNGFALVRQRYSRETSIVAWKRCFTAVLGAESVRRAPAPQTDAIATHGRLESFFGQALATRIRELIRKPAYIGDAGDEWPHSFMQADSSYIKRFDKTLRELES
ncbi:MAG: glycosyltransferase family 4 protein [Pseudomonadota bacterium]